MRFVFGLMSVLIFSSCGSSSQTLKKKIEQENFSGAALVVKKGKILLNQGFGEASVEKQIANTPQTQFLIGSITKMFTAAAILKLVEEGQLHESQTVSAVLKPDDPVWKGEMPAWADQVTIHQLLTHTSGLVGYTHLLDFDEFYESLHTPEEIVQFFASYPLKFSPGAQFDYRGTNYQLLGLMIERVSGKRYGDYLREKFFQPLKMKSTMTPSDFLSNTQKQDSRIAFGYVEIGRLAGEVNLSTAYAEAGILSTVGDLWLWTQGLFGKKVVGESSIQKMTTPAVCVEGHDWTGKGIYIDLKDPNKPIYYTTGIIQGYTSIWIYEPKEDVLVALLSNVMNDQTFKLGNALFDEIYSLSVMP